MAGSTIGKNAWERAQELYGPERVTWYKMSREMGPPETFAWEYPMADDSWETENATFVEDIRLLFPFETMIDIRIPHRCDTAKVPLGLGGEQRRPDVRA